MANGPRGPSVAAASTTASGDGSRNMITGPRLRPRQPHSFPNARKLSRNAPSPQTQRGRVPGAEAPGSLEKKRKAAPTDEEEQQEGAEAPSPSGISKAGKPCASASLAPRDPIGAASSKDLVQWCTGERAVIGSAMSLPMKRICTRSRNYMRFFTGARGEAEDVVTRSARSPVPAKTNKVKESPFQNLQRLPDGCHPDFDNDHLYSVNKLREFWHKSQGAVLVDDKERVMKTILFILSVLPDACKPFLLVTIASLPSWEAEFSLFAPSINVAVYDGEKDVRKLIQNPEFHENRRHTMLHVLIAHPDITLEDIKNVGGIGGCYC